MSKIDIEGFIENFHYLLNSPSSLESLINFVRDIKALVREENYETDFDKKAAQIVHMVETSFNGGAILILKNSKSLFDVYIFDHEVSFSPINVTSSETLQDTIRRKPEKGWIVDNVLPEDILVFLKAYYVYRDEPGVSSSANNIVNEYGNTCLEMKSIGEKFKSDDLMREIPVSWALLYDSEALPYHLGYLNKYREEVAYMKEHDQWYRFSSTLDTVRKNKFLGMSLTRL